MCLVSWGLGIVDVLYENLSKILIQFVCRFLISYTLKCYLRLILVAREPFVVETFLVLKWPKSCDDLLLPVFAVGRHVVHSDRRDVLGTRKFLLATYAAADVMAYAMLVAAHSDCSRSREQSIHSVSDAISFGERSLRLLVNGAIKRICTMF